MTVLLSEMPDFFTKEEVQAMNVLVIDDNEDIRFLLSKTLPYNAQIDEIRTAADGSEAVAMCADFQPDIVITDCRMAGPPAELTSVKIRTLFPSVRIVAFSGTPGDYAWADVQIEKGHQGMAELTALLETDEKPRNPG